MNKRIWIFSGVYIRMAEMSYVRQYRRGGSTYVQVVFKDGRRISKIIHIGTAHDQVELDVLLKRAEEIRTDKNQQSLFRISGQESDLLLGSTASKLLYSLILNNYNHLGFNEIDDEVFQHLVVARIV